MCPVGKCTWAVVVHAEVHRNSAHYPVAPRPGVAANSTHHPGTPLAPSPHRPPEPHVQRGILFLSYSTSVKTKRHRGCARWRWFMRFYDDWFFFLLISD